MHGYVGRDITKEEEAAVVSILASAAVSTGVVCGELGAVKGHYHLQCLWRVCASSTAAITSYIKQKVSLQVCEHACVCVCLQFAVSAVLACLSACNLFVCLCFCMVVCLRVHP